MSTLKSMSAEIAAVVQRVRPAVLHLRVMASGRGPGGSGSGFLCGGAGLALTNAHVVHGALAVEATFHDGRTAVVDVLGTDVATDLALLRIPDETEVPLELRADEPLMVGEFALAVGCPHGLSHSVSAGIVSGTGRSLPGANGRSIEDVIQTDAPLNPGNSGGPLLDCEGRVVGIATAIVPHAQGLCFAVPAATAAVVLPELRDHGHVMRGWLGVAVQGVEIAPTIARRLGLPAARALAVVTVTPGSPAARAGVDPGDLLISLGSRTVRGVGDLIAGMPRDSIGRELPLRVLRHNEILPLVVRPALAPRQAA
ncbi:MAG: trypsin-like peptidase domain-containing protein [Planctomycetes bacterium]|nr:trypsin-like peptidase domain-containing protein [Planctomycetota bacterium]